MDPFLSLPVAYDGVLPLRGQGAKFMQRAQTLRERANALRALAKSFESPTIRSDLVVLAKRCEELAHAAEREVRKRGYPTIVKRAGEVTQPRGARWANSPAHAAGYCAVDRSSPGRSGVRSRFNLHNTSQPPSRPSVDKSKVTITPR